MDKCIPDAAIRRAWLNPEMTSAAAAASIGLSRVGLWARAKAMGLPARRDGRRPVIPEAELAALWSANVMVREIGRLYGCPRESVSQLARHFGLPPRPKGKHRPISLTAYRSDLVRRANSTTGNLTPAERLILQKSRPQ